MVKFPGPRTRVEPRSITWPVTVFAFSGSGRLNFRQHHLVCWTGLTGVAGDPDQLRWPRRFAAPGCRWPGGPGHGIADRRWRTRL